MTRKLSAFRRSFQSIAAISSLLLLAAGCGTHKEDFIAGHVLDHCDQSWPVCNTYAGCLIGAQSYVEGRFPNSGKFIVQLAEPSTVTVHVYLEEIGSAGTDTAITFYETECSSRTRLDITGKEFVAESQQNDEVTRSTDLSGTGDHLIEFTSDAQARYTIKADVVPIRLKSNQ